jgi:hypothetical protein
MSAEIFHFPPQRFNPAHRVMRIETARAALETCQFFRQCEEAARDAIDDGDIVEAMHQIVTLASFQISEQAPSKLNNERRMLLLDLIDYATDRAQGAARQPSN